ncbi:MAG: TonB-dependent receptor, partial [Flavobacteriaceae bacterium]
QHLAILKGKLNSEDDALLIKANNRAYLSSGIQTKLDYHWYGASGIFHDLEVGARIHYDEEDRFQWEDGYRIENGTLSLTSQGPQGAKGNRIASAQALAAYALYKFKYNKLTLTPGLRMESISLEREDFGEANPNRNIAELIRRENNSTAWIPGIGFNYTFSNQLSLFGGLHKGFSPPGNAPGELPESSINYELGSRFSSGKLRGEFIGFFNDYSNLLGSDLAASGGTGSLDQFNAGSVHVSGIELLLNFDFAPKEAAIQLPVTFAYTLTDAIFQSSFGSDADIWGAVATGDRVPYIPQNQWSLTARVVHKKIEFNCNARYTSAFHIQAAAIASSESATVPSNFIIDLSAKYNLSSRLKLTTQVVNLLNETYLVSRVPAGFRPGHPFGIYSGVQFDL